ncbi:MAG: DUF1540 domain-containing protein [Lachnospiraceae bacterium]|nr:DUF1540 domain-containing protein [Lachnospiraceae bacterium]
MSQLDCTVTNCTFNKVDCCCKGDILVGGSHADCDEDTCCESFSERNNDSFTNSIEHPSKTINIDCEAMNCTYNSNYKCIAERVDICGNNAHAPSGTLCATFVERS